MSSITYPSKGGWSISSGRATGSVERGEELHLEELPAQLLPAGGGAVREELHREPAADDLADGALPASAQQAARPVPGAARVDDLHDGLLDEATLGRQHPAGLHRGGARADVDEQFAAFELLPDARNLITQECEEGLVIRGIIAHPRSLLDPDTGLALHEPPLRGVKDGPLSRGGT